jgi:4-amino-4-deoxy-L-arabinose transferase-like glycosyltransferase
MVGRVPSPLDRRDVVTIAVLGLIGVGIPLWMASAAGAIGIPTLDDWLYMQAADGLLHTGAVHMALHSTAVVGQLVLVQPLLWLSGGNAWAFTAFGLLMASVGIACTYLLARRFVGPASAALAVLLVLTFPGFSRESASFMTDVPAYALTMVCLLLGTRWFQGDGGRVIMVAALAAGLLAISIREFAAAAPLAILLAGWARNRPDERLWLACLTGAFVVGVALVLTVAGVASHVAPGTPDKSVILSFAFLGPAFATLAVVLLPALAQFASTRISTLRPEVILAAAITSLVVLLAPTGPLLGNVWTASGIGADLLLGGKRDLIFGGRLWPLFEQIAVFAAILATSLIFTAARPRFLRVNELRSAWPRALQVFRGPQGPVFVFLVLYAAELVVYTPFGPILDRYLYPMVPAAAILLLRRRPEKVALGRSIAISHATLAWLAVTAFAIAANSFAYDAARWREGDAVVAMGYNARVIDAGYEWVGYYADRQTISGDEPFVLNWYYAVVPADPPCAVVSNSLLGGGVLRLIHVDKEAYLQYLFFGPAEPLYLYGASTEGCPALPATSAIAPAP